MNKLDEIEPVYVENIPSELEHGKLYISTRHGFANHLCACGCGIKTVIGVKPNWDDGWTMTEKDGKITLRPSIGNFTWDKPTYHAHYYITDNKIEWL